MQTHPGFLITIMAALNKKGGNNALLLQALLNMEIKLDVGYFDIFSLFEKHSELFKAHYLNTVLQK